MLRRKPAPSRGSTFGCCHTQEAAFHVLPYVGSILPWGLMLSPEAVFEAWCGPFTEPTWISLWRLRHWSQPIKFTKDKKQEGTSKPKYTFPISESYIQLSQCKYRNNHNNNNYHWLNQKLYMQQTSKCFTTSNPLVTECVASEPAEIYGSTWGLMNENLHCFCMIPRLKITGFKSYLCHSLILQPKSFLPCLSALIPCSHSVSRSTLKTPSPLHW